MMLIFVYLLLCVLYMSGGGLLTLALKEDTNVSLCIEKERQALLDVRSNITGHVIEHDWWNPEELDCCKWVGVSCNNHTGHVIGIDLGHVVEDWQLSYDEYVFSGKFSPSLQVLNHLQHLNLNYIDFQSVTLPNFLPYMSNLRSLHLSGANLTGPIPHQLANLSNLFHLDLSCNSLTGSIIFSFRDFTSLTYLDLSQNQIGGLIPKSFGNSSSLVYMDLSQNLLNGSLPKFSRCSSLMNILLAHNSLNGSMPDFTRCAYLESLDLSNNFLSGDISNSVGQLMNLKYLSVGHNSVKGSMHSSLGQLLNLAYLDVSHNSLNGSIPNFIGCPSLRFLDMSSNELSGNVPKSLGQLSKLGVLDFSSNSLKGVISKVHFLNLTNLNYLDLSFNSLTINLSFHGMIPSQLSTIKMQSCKLGPKFPMWIKTQYSFTYLDISNVGISDVIPTWFWGLSSALRFMNLSSNDLKGRLPDMGYPLKFFDKIYGLDLSNNHFEGRLPSLPTLATLNLSGNKFSGTLSFLCEINGSLRFLDLSNNSLSGSLPDCWSKFQLKLVVLNLSYNNFSGEIPSSLGFLSNLESLSLRTNTFVGDVPMSLSNCTRLKFVDLRENKLSGVIPEWIGEKLSELYVLVLGSNRFTGRLPSQICWLYNLQVLDLSNNGLSGNIPRCFDNFTAMARRGFGDDMIGHFYYSYVGDQYMIPCASPLYHVAQFRHTDSERGQSHPLCPNPLDQDTYYFDNTWVTWKGTERSFGRSSLQLLTNIDLSRNNLSGKIPYEITGLYELVTLNLSLNKLHGEIPKDMGHLKSLESLDLSKNKLSGKIPSSLSQITSLSYLDLSYNNLSGRIPTGTQLQSFNYTSYIGNGQLCGPPLTPRCGFVPEVVGKKDVEEEEEEDGDEDDLGISYYLGIGFGFGVGFWGICGALLFNRRCRYLFFASLSCVFGQT